MGSANSMVCTLEEVESLSAARVELERRRIDKQGRVKQKLSVVGLRCVDCAVSKDFFGARSDADQEE